MVRDGRRAGGEIRRSELSQTALKSALRELVAIPSVNPGTSEKAIALHVARRLREAGIEPALIEAMPGRPSVAAVISGDAPGLRLVLNSHLDTVPIGERSGWSVDPFGGSENGHVVYGRGACDDKAGVAITLALARAYRQRSASIRGSLVCHFAAGEERAEPGTLALIEAGYGGDFGIVLEATDLAVASCARGLVYFTIRLYGRSGHASDPSKSINPLVGLRYVLEALDDLDQRLRGLTHPLLPSPSCTPTMVRAGVSENTVPQSCELTVDRRLLPGEDIEAARAEIRECVERVLRGSAITFELETLPMRYEACETDPNSPFVQHVMRQMSATLGGGPSRLIGTAYSSDMRVLINDAGMEAVTFGPGRLADCHAVAERIDIRAVAKAAHAVARVVETVLSTDSPPDFGSLS